MAKDSDDGDRKEQQMSENGQFGMMFTQFIDRLRGKAFSGLKKKFSPSLSDEDINDIYQNASLAMYENIRDGKVDSLLEQYFLKICYNQACKLLRDRKQESVMDIDDFQLADNERLDEILNACQVNEETSVTERKAKVMNSILDEMTERCRDLLIGHFVNGFSWGEMASLCGLSSAESARNTAQRCKGKVSEKYDYFIKKIYG